MVSSALARCSTGISPLSSPHPGKERIDRAGPRREHARDIYFSICRHVRRGPVRTGRRELTGDLQTCPGLAGVLWRGAEEFVARVRRRFFRWSERCVGVVGGGCACRRLSVRGAAVSRGVRRFRPGSFFFLGIRFCSALAKRGTECDDDDTACEREPATPTNTDRACSPNELASAGSRRRAAPDPPAIRGRACR